LQLLSIHIQVEESRAMLTVGAVVTEEVVEVGNL
jgi:hypothetical protein